MKIAILKERRPHETRVAATPETIKKLKALGAEVTIEAGAGTAADAPACGRTVSLTRAGSRRPEATGTSTASAAASVARFAAGGVEG